MILNAKDATMSSNAFARIERETTELEDQLAIARAERFADQELCPRTLAAWKHGVPLPGVTHNFAYRGLAQSSGPHVCTLCGKIKD